MDNIRIFTIDDFLTMYSSILPLQATSWPIACDCLFPADIETPYPEDYVNRMGVSLKEDLSEIIEMFLPLLGYGDNDLNFLYSRKLLLLTLSQTTIIRLFQTVRVCRRQFQI